MTDIVNWDTGAVIHSTDGDIRATMEAAAKRRISCFRARLDGARLDGARLDGAILDGASLVGARLDGAILDGASLVGASLVGARLVGARLPIYCQWPVTHTVAPDLLVHIGCKSKSVVDWDAWFSGSDEYDTPRDSDDFRRIRASYLAVRAYLVAMELVK